VLISTSRRLPGFQFETQPPPSPDVLPRMDVSVFVGFAACGPLHVPVVVEDAAQFAIVFGDDVILGRDAERGEPASAHLGPAVRAFFRNGGRRCWVIRVADAAQARTGLFPVYGLAQVDLIGGQTTIRPAFARARCPGSWADSWRLGATVSSAGVAVRDVDAGGLIVAPAVAGALRPGDLLRCTYCDEGYTLLLMARSIEEVGPGSPPDVPGYRVDCAAIWLQTVTASDALPAGAEARLFTGSAEPEKVPVLAGPFPAGGGGPQLQRPCADQRVGDATAGDLIGLTVAQPPAGALVPGSLLGVAGVGEEWWLLVQTIDGDENGSPLEATVNVIGPAFRRLAGPPQPWPAGDPVVDRLSTELWARSGQGEPLRLADLGFGPAHPRFWGTLPDDRQLFAESEPFAPPALWSQVRTPRFPIAGPAEMKPDSFTFPVAMLTLPEVFLPPLPSDEPSLRRDGLETFSANLFLDPSLARATSLDLMASADFIRYQAERPRALLGIHAALAIEEATLIAVPDAVHPGWEPALLSLPAPPRPVAPLARPEWWRFQGCGPLSVEQLTTQPEWSEFHDRALRVVAPPVLTHDTPDPTGTFTLYWESDEPDARYILEESPDPGFESGLITIYEGPASQIVIYGRPPGHYYYHARLEVGGNRSDWSKGIVMSIYAAGSSYWMFPASGMQPGLGTIQRALLRLCAARGDMMAVLSLPAHYREEEALRHTALLQPGATFTPPGDSSPFTVPLGYGETKALSYGALYHPWLVEGDGAQVRSAPPDGAMCGLIARRALSRGAWISPANEQLVGVVALMPPMAPRHRLSLLEAQINLIRQEPYGFVPLSADTLSPDPELRPINVRRLLILLRRLALRWGATFVFEPYDDVFRRSVQRRFESLLENLFVRGAFAGKTAASSFQVVTASSPNDRDQGRFIVELRVAPSRPLTFLIVRLVQSGDRNLVIEGAI